MSLLAGVSRVVITPPIGSDLSGFMAESRKAEGVHDDVYAKCLVLAANDIKVALICCDLLGVDADFARLIKWEIRKQISIAPQNVMICASHTHSSAAVHFLRGCGTPFPRYIRDLGAKLVAVAKDAAAHLCPATVAFTRAEYNLALNRREKQSNNTMEQESGTVDNEVGIIRIDSVARPGESRNTHPPAMRPLAVIYNYATHPVVLGGDNKQVSADYPGVASRVIESQTGAMAFFLQGCCGNINPKIRGNFETAEKAGTGLAQRVIGAWQSLGEVQEAEAPTETLDANALVLECARGSQPKPTANFGRGSETVLNILSTTLDLPLDGPPTLAQAQAEVAKAEQEIASKGPILHLRWRLQWAQDVLRHVQEGRAPRTIAAPVQALRIGDGAVVALPGEEFVETGLRIKSASPAAGRTLVAAYANSANMGYVPIREAYPKMGYEVYGAHMWYGLFRLAPGGAEAITDAALALLKKLF